MEIGLENSGWSLKMAVLSLVGDIKIVSPISTFVLKTISTKVLFLTTKVLFLTVLVEKHLWHQHAMPSVSFTGRN